jgi:hypothetical protein
MRQYFFLRCIATPENNSPTTEYLVLRCNHSSGFAVVFSEDFPDVPKQDITTGTVR